MLSRLRLPSPATMIACLALFFAIGGSAIALQGRNSVDSGDIKPKAVKTSDIANNAVTTKKIKNNHVRAADIQNNAVGTGEIRNGQVAAGDLALQEAYRKVGQPGQPAFSNGGEGDCLWASSTTSPLRINPVAFYKDAFGRVHLSGAAVPADGPGGDAMCGGAGDEVVEDGIAFVLPEGYAPANDELRPPVGGGGTLVISAARRSSSRASTSRPARSINAGGGGGILLEGISFRAAGPGKGLPRRGSAAGGAELPGLGDLFE